MEKINIGLLLIILLANLYLILLKDYFREKGKNFATKEDIEEITEKIENVKIALSHSQQQKANFLDQHKLALINFYDDYIHWHEYSIKNISVTINHVNNPEPIRQEIENLTLQKSKIDKSFWRLCLFEAHDKDFIEMVKSIHLETSKLHHITFDFLINMEQSATKMKYKVGEINERVDERKKIMDEFVKDRDEQEGITIKLPNLLMNLIRKKFIALYN
jgi:hypothetical protein